MIESKAGQRLIGLVLIALGAALTAWTWHSALTEGSYYPALAMLGPMLAVCGPALIVFPLDYERFRAEHGVSKPEKWEHYPTAWKAVLVLATVAGLANFLTIRVLWWE